MLRSQFTHFGLKHGLAGVLSIFQNTSLRRYYHAKGLDVYDEVHRLKAGDHHDGLVLSVTDRLASRLDKAMYRMSLMQPSKARSSQPPRKEEEGDEEQGLPRGSAAKAGKSSKIIKELTKSKGSGKNEGDSK